MKENFQENRKWQNFYLFQRQSWIFFDICLCSLLLAPATHMFRFLVSFRAETNIGEKVLRNHQKSCKQFILTENTNKNQSINQTTFHILQHNPWIWSFCTVSLSSHTYHMWHYVCRNWTFRNRDRMFQCQKIHAFQWAEMRRKKNKSQSKNLPFLWKRFYYAKVDFSRKSPYKDPNWVTTTHYPLVLRNIFKVQCEHERERAF